MPYMDIPIGQKYVYVSRADLQERADGFSSRPANPYKAVSDRVPVSAI